MPAAPIRVPPVFYWWLACQNRRMKEIPEIADFLRELPGFDCLDDAATADCAKNIEIGYYRRGDDIMTIGSDNCCVRIIRSGAVELRNGDEPRPRLPRRRRSVGRRWPQWPTAVIRVASWPHGNRTS